ncbi:MAG: alanine racemase [Rhodoferax sp.]|nr:alanine racemase [Actinomycetota bacterium]
MATSTLPAEAVVDLSAVRENVRELCRRAPSAQVMAVVKADGYGHGLLPCAAAARAGGATWLGGAQLAEGLSLRAAGDQGRLLSWLHVPGDDFAGAVRVGIDLSASAPWAVDQIADAARSAGGTARVHLKIDTGLSRGGATPTDWDELVGAALAAQAEGAVSVVGVWSHLAWADAPDHPTVRHQREVFDLAVARAEALGVRPEVRHLANSAATLTNPAAHYDLVRPGLAVYGLSPVPDLHDAAALGLRPAMSLRATLALVKRVPAGSGVAYGHTYVTERETVLALVPLGYADGVPRAAGNVGPLLVAGAVHRIAGRVSMDQVVVDLGDDAAARDCRAGDPVVLFGDGAAGEPTAQDWAQATGTIAYEIVARIGARVPRTHVGGDV